MFRGSRALIVTFLMITVATIYSASFNCVEHKNSQLDLYLDHISYNCQEKIGILPYIVAHPQGTYLEIGTGGDPIAQMFSKIPATSQATIIASDIDEDILALLPIRHPQLSRFIDATNGPKLVLQQLNAIDMHAFADCSLDGINASSVLHEIFSYEHGYDGVETFIKEAFRTLKARGVLVYRDPAGVADRDATVCVRLKTKTMRLFAHIFLYKFLDHRGSLLAQDQRKTGMYATDGITFCIYKKNEAQPINLSYNAYLNVPSYAIDFSRRYEIKLPLGLYLEMARHYMTYLRQCNPLVFVQYVPDLHANAYTINYFAHGIAEILNAFFSEYDWDIKKNRVSNEQKNKIEIAIAENAKVLEFGIPLRFASKIKENQLHSLLLKYDFSPSTHIIALDNDNFLLDYRIFGMLYDEINDILFDQYNGILNKDDEEHAKWLKREGEEYYFYYSEDELITHIAYITYEASLNEHDMQHEAYVLCPINADASVFIHRICYSELQKTVLEVKDALGYDIEVSDGKRIVHFCKMKLNEALDVYQKMIDADPLRYPNLQKCVKHMQKNSYHEDKK